MKRFLPLIIVAMLVFSGCGKQKDNSIDYTPVSIKDNYRNFYEIFVGAYSDSDKDGTGDLKGLINKLDYLNDGNPKTHDDLGVDGIWLMPVSPSPSYHKYDVTDYYGIDKAYGTLDDFKELLSQSHKRGINVIIDMVLNHTSSQMEWFTSAKDSIVLYGDEAFDKNSPHYNKYTEYYNFKKGEPSGSYHSVGNGYVYEAMFWDGMPDLNLDSLLVREEIINICRYWLDMGVDGFRLDAVKEFYSGQTTKNTEFMSWLMTELKKIKSDVYVVGEAWSNGGEIKELYKSGITSLFNYPMSNADGDFFKAVLNGRGEKCGSSLVNWNEEILKSNPDAIDAPFLTNHDNGRSAGGLRRTLENEKMAAALYMLAPGNPFIYYGEEIGMTGSGKDENKRQPMVWSSKNDESMAKPVSGSGTVEKPENGVKEQSKDSNSLLSYYRSILKIKNANPEIARGRIEKLDYQKETVMAYSCEYNNSRLYIIHNTGKSTENIVLDKDKQYSYELRGTLTTGKGKIELDNGKVKLPAFSSVVIKVKE